MRLAFSTLACPDWTWSQVVDAARTHGYEGIEWRLIDGEMVSGRTPAAQVREIRAAVEKAGLESCALDSSLYLAHAPGQARDAALAEATVLLGLARELGAPWLRTFVGPFPKGSTEAQAVGWTIDLLRALLPVAEREGVGVALETHAFEGRGLDVSGTSDSAICRRVTQAVPGRSLGINWDIGNPYAEGEAWGETWANVRDRLAYLHVKDAVRRPDGKWAYVLNGEGELPIPAIVRKLRQAGFEGWLSYEWEKKWHPDLPDAEVALPVYVKHMKGIL